MDWKNSNDISVLCSKVTEMIVYILRSGDKTLISTLKSCFPQNIRVKYTDSMSNISKASDTTNTVSNLLDNYSTEKTYSLQLRDKIANGDGRIIFLAEGISLPVLKVLQPGPKYISYIVVNMTIIPPFSDNMLKLFRSLHNFSGTFSALCCMNIGRCLGDNVILDKTISTEYCDKLGLIGPRSDDRHPNLNCDQFMTNEWCAENTSDKPECSCYDTYDIKNPVEKAVYDQLHKMGLQQARKCVIGECKTCGYQTGTMEDATCNSLCAIVLDADAGDFQNIDMENINQVLNCESDISIACTKDINCPMNYKCIDGICKTEETPPEKKSEKKMYIFLIIVAGIFLVGIPIMVWAYLRRPRNLRK